MMQDTIAWNSVKELRLGLNMSDRIQRDSLRKILDSVPLLSNLSILVLHYFTNCTTFLLLFGTTH